jgi:amino-acid N-acetyltransferase
MSSSVALRLAESADVGAVHRLITQNIEAGHLLPRTAEDVGRHAARFIVARHESGIVGCAELAPLSEGVAEIRSLVVDEPFRGRHIGMQLVEQIASAASRQGYATLCAFTHEPSRFVRMGFTIVPHVWLPEKIAHDCTACPLFRRCGQYAVMLPLRSGVNVRPEPPAAIIQGGRTIASKRSNLERLQLRPTAAREPDRAEAVLA